MECHIGATGRPNVRCGSQGDIKPRHAQGCVVKLIRDGALVEILISTTDDPNALVPQFHIHHDDRIDWFEIADGLPRFHGWGDDGSAPYRHGLAIKGPSG